MLQTGVLFAHEYEYMHIHTVIGKIVINFYRTCSLLYSNMTVSQYCCTVSVQLNYFLTSGVGTFGSSTTALSSSLGSTSKVFSSAGEGCCSGCASMLDSSLGG